MQAWPGVDMDVASELLGPGTALLLLLLLLLGAVASLCVHCSRPGMKRSEKILEQRILQENQQSFVVARTCSLASQSCPGLLMDSSPESESARKKLLLFSPAPEASRYQDISKGSRLDSDTTYISPIPEHCQDSGFFQKLPRAVTDPDADDTGSYENVLICRQSPDSGASSSNDYQNAPTIRHWRLSQGRSEPARRENKDDEDEEPDYVNGDVVTSGV